MKRCCKSGILRRTRVTLDVLKRMKSQVTNKVSIEKLNLYLAIFKSRSINKLLSPELRVTHFQLSVLVSLLQHTNNDVLLGELYMFVLTPCIYHSLVFECGKEAVSVTCYGTFIYIIESGPDLAQYSLSHDLSRLIYGSEALPDQ